MSTIATPLFTATLPPHLSSRLCRSFLFVAGMPVMNGARAERVRRHVRAQLGIDLNARVSHAFMRTVVNPEGMARLQTLVPFYRWQLAIGLLANRLTPDWFARVGLHFKAKMRAVTRARMREMTGFSVGPKRA